MKHGYQKLCSATYMCTTGERVKTFYMSVEVCIFISCWNRSIISLLANTVLNISALNLDL